MAGTVFQFKSIKPARLNVQGVRDRLLLELREQATETEDELYKTVATWNNPPDFETIIDVGPDAVAVTGPTGDGDAVQHFMWVDQGTKPHMIRPKSAGGRLRFNSQFTAKTRPRVIGSSSGSSGGDVVYARQVYHPGTEAREFMATVQAKRASRFKRAMEEAMKLGADNAWGS